MRVAIHSKSGHTVINAEAGESLYSVIKRAEGVTFDAPCGGKHTCGKCRVTARGGVSPVSAEERKFLPESELKGGARLACLTQVGGDCEVWLSDAAPMSIQVEGLRSRRLDFSPVAGRDGEKIKWGAAVDIGTTTVAVYLCDLTRGEIAATDALVNPQRAYGADVITRIGYVIDNPGGAEKLRSAIISAINESIARLCASLGITPDEIGAAAIAGNTVMQHLAAGRDARGIANAPFTVSTLFGYALLSDEAGLHIAPGAEVYFMPLLCGICRRRHSVGPDCRRCGRKRRSRAVHRRRD